MTNEQLNMMLKILESTHKLVANSFSLEMRHRFSCIYELDLINEGAKITLKVGPINECMDAAKDYLNIRYFM